MMADTVHVSARQSGIEELANALLQAAIRREKDPVGTHCGHRPGHDTGVNNAATDVNVDMDTVSVPGIKCTCCALIEQWLLLEQSEDVRSAILPGGKWHNRIDINLFNHRATLKVTLDIGKTFKCLPDNANAICTGVKKGRR